MQANCLNYLENDSKDKLILLGVPYISSERACGIKVYNYDPFHKKVAEYLQKAEYPFLTFAGTLRLNLIALLAKQMQNVL